MRFGCKYLNSLYLHVAMSLVELVDPGVDDVELLHLSVHYVIEMVNLCSQEYQIIGMRRA